MKSHLKQFIELSRLLTGFSRIDLEATGLVTTYLDVLEQDVSETLLADLFGLAAKIASQSKTLEQMEEDTRVQIIANPKYGTLAKNIVKMWYLGSWNGGVVSAEAYKEGLLWPAIGSHPQAAKQPGYGSWSLPPKAKKAAAAKGKG